MTDPNAGTSGPPLAVVADDDELIRTVLRFALESLGITVLEASTGAAAVAAVHSNPVDLVILDVRFPGETFEQTWVNLCAARLPQPAIIVLSGDAAGPAETHGPLVEFLHKPVDFAELEASIARLLPTSLPRGTQ